MDTRWEQHHLVFWEGEPQSHLGLLAVLRNKLGRENHFMLYSWSHQPLRTSTQRLSPSMDFLRREGKTRSFQQSWVKETKSSESGVCMTSSTPSPKWQRGRVASLSLEWDTRFAPPAHNRTFSKPLWFQFALLVTSRSFSSLSLSCSSEKRW